MKKTEKIRYLLDNYYREYDRARAEAWTELSEEQPFRCCCGRLATGRHEQTCPKFQQKVASRAIEKLKHLLPKSRRKKDGENSFDKDFDY